MTATATRPATVGFPALGTTALLVVADGSATARAREVLELELAAIDLACSRFRPDSELSRANTAQGRPFRVGALFAAELTDGLVDPTVGPALTALGYDRTFATVRPEDVRPVLPVPAVGWRHVEWNPGTRWLRLPPGAGLDLGATAKALAADRAAERAARAVGCGVLVSLGGDLSTAGRTPVEGWRVQIADHHNAPAPVPGPVVALHSGGLATSGTVARTWRRGGRTLHHLVDPATGNVPAPCWRTVSVAAASCADANTASTAAVLLGEQALRWLQERALPGRLVRTDGTVVTVCGWPGDPADPPTVERGAR